MSKELAAVIDEHYQPTSEEDWHRCLECGEKVHASPDDYSDLALHEVRAHPER